MCDVGAEQGARGNRKQRLLPGPRVDLTGAVLATATDGSTLPYVGTWSGAVRYGVRLYTTAVHTRHKRLDWESGNWERRWGRKTAKTQHWQRPTLQPARYHIQKEHKRLARDQASDRERNERGQAGGTRGVGAGVRVTPGTLLLSEQGSSGDEQGPGHTPRTEISTAINRHICTGTAAILVQTCSNVPATHPSRQQKRTVAFASPRPPARQLDRIYGMGTLTLQ